MSKIEIIKNELSNDYKELISSKKIKFTNLRKEKILKIIFFISLIFFSIILSALLICWVTIYNNQNWPIVAWILGGFSIIIFFNMIIIYILKMQQVKLEISNNDILNQTIDLNKYLKELDIQISDIELSNMILWTEHFDFFSLKEKNIKALKGISSEDKENIYKYFNFYIKTKKKWTLNSFEYSWFEVYHLEFKNKLLIENNNELQLKTTLEMYTENSDRFLTIESIKDENNWKYLPKESQNNIFNELFKKHFFQPNILIFENKLVMISKKMKTDYIDNSILIDKIENSYSEEELFSNTMTKIYEIEEINNKSKSLTNLFKNKS